MIIRDIHGARLRLTATKLYELDAVRVYGSGYTPETEVLRNGGVFFVKLSDLKEEKTGSADPTNSDSLSYVSRWAQLRTKGSPDGYGYIHITAANDKVGCHTFSPTTFKKIIAAVKRAKKEVSG